MSESQQPLDVVKHAYACFGRQDTPGVLATLDENVRWTFHANPADVPIAGARVGRQSVGEFFTLLATHYDVLQFEPKQFLVGPDHVTVIVQERVKSKKSGKELQQFIVHVFQVKNAGSSSWTSG